MLRNSRGREVKILVENRRECCLSLPPSRPSPYFCLPDGCIWQWVLLMISQFSFKRTGHRVFQAGGDTLLVCRSLLKKSSLAFILISALSPQRSSRWGDSELGYFFLPLPDGLRGFSSLAFSLGLPSADARTPAGVSSVPHLAGRRLPHAPFLPGSARAAGALRGRCPAEALAPF